MKKPKVLILYDFFYPGYKAGGPVQSLINMIIALQCNYEFSVITTAFDLMTDKPYDTVQYDKWSSVQLPGMSLPLKVWYSGKQQLQYATLERIIAELNPEVIYLNGIYSLRLFLFPLIINKFSNKYKIVVCPRGMLQSGALAVKGLKKKFYLKALQISGLLKNVTWHATNEEEANDITNLFPVHNAIYIAFNVPKTPYKTIKFIEKEEGKLNLVYLSLITQKKNLLLLLKVLLNLPSSVCLHVYGPIKDEAYWNECNLIISRYPQRFFYHGDVEPVNVQITLEQYHAMCILTKGENFGHALYECLSVGRPLITSYYTPWNNLNKEVAGENVRIEDLNDCINKIMLIANSDQKQFDVMCKNANLIASKYFYSLNTIDMYQKLFS